MNEKSLEEFFEGAPDLSLMSDHDYLVTFFLEIFFTLIIVPVENRIVGLFWVCGMSSDQNDNELVIFVDG
jgi:hypothetical protein